MTFKLLSVVVIGRNEGSRLDRCLRSIETMQLPDLRHETIYVDSASVDDSVSIAHSHGAAIVALDGPPHTAARARNAGYAKSSGDLVLFLDGDTVLDPSFVMNSLAEFEDPSVAVVCGRRRELNARASVFNRVVDLDWIAPPGFVEYCGGDALIWRAVLDQVGGYDETLIAGEEPELCCRMRTLGWRILHVARPMTGHDIGMHAFSQYWRRATRTGYAYAQVSERFRKSPIKLWSAEAGKNQRRALTLSLGFLLIAGSSLLLRNVWPWGIGFTLLSGLAARTALKNRWKTSEPLTLLLYGIHSHFQQIPIYLGQLQYLLDARGGRSRSLIEYKKPEYKATH